MFQLLYSLPVSKLQESVEPLLFYLLLGFQHSETVFHQIVTGLPEVFKQLSKSATVQSLKSGGNTRSQSILNRLKEAVAFLINQFPGFPELYNGVIQWLEQSGQPELTEERIKGRVVVVFFLAICVAISRVFFFLSRTEKPFVVDSLRPVQPDRVQNRPVRTCRRKVSHGNGRSHQPGQHVLHELRDPSAVHHRNVSLGRMLRPKF